MPIRGELVLNARRFTAPDQTTAPLVLGVDVARGGGDKTRIVDRRGRCAGHKCNEVIDTADLMEVTGRVAREIDRLNPNMTFIDVTGIGAGVYALRLTALPHRLPPGPGPRRWRPRRLPRRPCREHFAHRIRAAGRP